MFGCVEMTNFLSSPEGVFDDRVCAEDLRVHELPEVRALQWDAEGLAQHPHLSEEAGVSQGLCFVPHMYERLRENRMHFFG